MAGSASQEPNPALQDLEILLGDWDMELSHAAFLPNPTDTATGHASFAWSQGGAVLVMTMGEKPPGAPDAVWLIDRDETSQDYTVLYYDARKVSRVYQMSFAAGVWKMWRDAAGFSQRYAAKFSENGSIAAYWEKSTDGKTWEHDFDITYTRVK